MKISKTKIMITRAVAVGDISVFTLYNFIIVVQGGKNNEVERVAAQRNCIKRSSDRYDT